MADFIFNDNGTTPMWVVWNAKYIPQNNTSQNILPPTNQPVSNINIISVRDNEQIIKDTIRMSKRKYFRDVQSCYRKVSTANSSWKRPTFDKIFISEMVFFSVLGKIIEESGGPHILDEYKILAKVQLIRFWKEKTTNDAKACMNFELLLLKFFILSRIWRPEIWKKFWELFQKKRKIWTVSNTNTSIPAPKNFMNLPKTTFCMSLQ